MAISRTSEFKEDDIVLARFAKALAHPARIEILKILAHRKICICNDLVQDLPLAQATVSQHLKELRGAGLIYGNEDGAKVCYTIDHEVWERMSTHFKLLLTSTELELSTAV